MCVRISNDVNDQCAFLGGFRETRIAGTSFFVILYLHLASWAFWGPGSGCCSVFGLLVFGCSGFYGWLAGRRRREVVGGVEACRAAFCWVGGCVVGMDGWVDLDVVRHIKSYAFIQ